MSNNELSRLEIMHKLQGHGITQSQAADILGISFRQVRRFWKTFKAKGHWSIVIDIKP